MYNVVYGNTSEYALRQGRDNLITILQGCAYKTAQCATVLLVDDNVVRDVNKTTSEVTRIGSLHGGVGKTLSGTVSRDKVLKHRHSFLKVGEDRILNNLCALGTCLLRLRHKTTHT